MNCGHLAFPPGTLKSEEITASQDGVQLEIPRAVLMRLLREHSLFVAEIRILNQRSRKLAREAIKAAVIHAAV